VGKALAKDPRDRFSSMEAFAAELEACREELQPGASDEAYTVRRPSAPVRRPMRARRRVSAAPVLVSLVALAALAVIVVAVVAVRGDHSGLPGLSPVAKGGSPVTLTAAGAYDPDGGGGEHDNEAANATDGDPTTHWTTEHYASQDFGGLKDGVGLVLDVPSARALKTLTVTSDTPGFTAVVKAGSSARAAQADSDSQTVGSKTTFDLNGLSGSVYVLWITRLAPGGYVHVNGVTATS
jgi:putative peptidoglycan lipid II flippase